MGVLLGAALAAAQTPLVEVWNDPKIDRYLYPSGVTVGPDQVADKLVWTDTAGEVDKQYVYVVGYMTNNFGGKFIATHRYDVDDPDSDVVLDYFPDDYATTTDEHRGVALVMDPNPGDIENPRLYVAGFTDDGEGNVNYVVIKYDKDLVRDDYSGEGWTSPNGYRIYDRGNGNDDVPVDVLYGVGPAGAQQERHVVIVGTSLVGTGDEDITTVWFDADNGDFLGDDHYDGPGSGVDTAAEAALAYMGGDPPGFGPAVIVAGTSYGGSETHDDLVAIMYNGQAGARNTNWSHGFGDGVQRYDGPDGGNELCTGIAHLPQRQDTGLARAVLIGRTPKYPAYTGDHEYLLFSVNNTDGTPFWDDEGYGDGARVVGVAANYHVSTARDAVVVETSEGFEVVVTGEEGLGSTRWGIGTYTVAIDSPSDGQTSGGMWILPNTSYSDNRGLRVTARADGVVYVAGWAASYTESLPARYVALRFAGGTTMPSHVGLTDINGVGDFGVTLWWHMHENDPPFSEAFEGVFIGGDTMDSTYGFDWGLVHLNP